MDNPAWIPIAFIALVTAGIILWQRSLRPRVEASVRDVAAALALQEQAAPDPRMRHYSGRILDLRVALASHADLDFVLGDGRLNYMGYASLTLRVLLAEPLPHQFRLDTSRSAEASVDGRTLGLDMNFKASSIEPESLRALLRFAPLREAINALPGTGRIVVVRQDGIRVSQAEPWPRRAVELAFAAVNAARLLEQARNFQREAAKPER